MRRFRLERIPLSGDTRKEAINCLQNRGINDQAKADIKICYDVANKIAKVMQDEMESFFLQYELPSQVSVSFAKKRKREQTSGHAGRPRRQVTEQEWTSASPGPITDGSRSPLAPQNPAQSTASLNVGDTAAGQSEDIEGPNPASIPRVTEVPDLGWSDNGKKVPRYLR